MKYVKNLQKIYQNDVIDTYFTPFSIVSIVKATYFLFSSLQTFLPKIRLLEDEFFSGF